MLELLVTDCTSPHTLFSGVPCYSLIGAIDNHQNRLIYGSMVVSRIFVPALKRRPSISS